MCLRIVNRQYDSPLKVDKIGYKVFQPNAKGLDGCFQEGHAYCLNTLIESPRSTIHGWSIDGVTVYEAGFHILASAKEAQELAKQFDEPSHPYKVYMVRFTDVVAVGYDRGRCAVARKMTILKRM